VVAAWTGVVRGRTDLGSGIPQLGCRANLRRLSQPKRRKLAPYWQQEGGDGVNIAKVFTDPRPADLAGRIQGWIRGWIQG